MVVTFDVFSKVCSREVACVVVMGLNVAVYCRSESRDHFECILV